MQRLAILVLFLGTCMSSICLCAGQQARESRLQKQTKAQTSAPSLKETLEFLGNAIPPGVDLNLSCTGLTEEMDRVAYLRRGYKFEASNFPVIHVTVTYNKEDSNGQTIDSPVYAIDLSRVDPERIRTEDRSGMTSQLGCGRIAPVFLVSLEGTNAQRIFASTAGDIPSKFVFFVSSKETADRITAAIKRAVLLAGGKTSAF